MQENQHTAHLKQTKYQGEEILDKECTKLPKTSEVKIEKNSKRTKKKILKTTLDSKFTKNMKTSNQLLVISYETDLNIVNLLSSQVLMKNGGESRNSI